MMNDPRTEDILLNMLQMAKEQTIAKTSQYRLFLKLKDKEALYDDHIVIAAIISKGFIGIQDDVTDESLDKIAETAIELFNDTYTSLLKDLNNDKGTANKVFKELVRTK